MMRVDNPSEVGADLIADAVGGKERYGNSLFIADLGTASKYLLIDEDGAYSGLAIAPGMKLSLDALSQNTAPSTCSLIHPDKDFTSDIQRVIPPPTSFAE